LHDSMALETALAPHIDRDERLLWSGQPRHGLRFRAQDVFLIPFSLLWGGFAVFWEVMVIRTGAPFFFIIWGVPFVLVGCYIVFGRFFVDARKRARTFYGVTDERILIVSGAFIQQIKSLQLRTLTDVTLTQRGDGSGAITFGPTQFMNSFTGGTSWPGTGRYVPPCFDMIEEAKEAYAIIRNAQRSASPTDTSRAPANRF
jgi:hypothetical protein